MKTNTRGSLIQTCLLAAALLVLPAIASAQDYTYETNNGAIAITSYIGTNNVVSIPDTINGLPVTSIEDGAFNGSSLTSVTIPDSVTRIGNYVFESCSSLTTVTIGHGVINIGDEAFAITALSNVKIPESVSTIGEDAFAACDNLTNVTIGKSVSSIGDDAFADRMLFTVFFRGNAPAVGSGIFDGDHYLTVYYLTGTLGWSNSFAGQPTALWFLPQPLILNQGPGFGVQSGQFGFTISWATNTTVVVKACTDLANPVWLAVSTNSLVGGTSYFSDPQPANLPSRFYRLRSP
jgi:hypothetical protein